MRARDVGRVAGVTLWLAAGAGLAGAQEETNARAGAGTSEGSEEMALAPSSPQAAEADVGLSVVLAYGSADEGRIDPALAGMQEYLEKRLPMKLGTLEEISTQWVGLTFNETAVLPLPEGEEIHVLPIAVVNGQLHLYLEMPGVNTRLRIQSDRPVILGGTPYRSGNVLVQITPQFHSGPTELDLKEQEDSAPLRQPTMMAQPPGGPGLGEGELVGAPPR